MLEGTGLGVGSGLQRMKGKRREVRWEALEQGLGTGRMGRAGGTVGLVVMYGEEGGIPPDCREAGVGV